MAAIKCKVHNPVKEVSKPKAQPKAPAKPKATVAPKED
jgi:hypothetical protein